MFTEKSARGALQVYNLLKNLLEQRKNINRCPVIDAVIQRLFRIRQPAPAARRLQPEVMAHKPLGRKARRNHFV